MTGRPRARSATNPSPPSAGSRTAAPPAARPRSAAAINNPVPSSPSRKSGAAAKSPSTNAPTAATDSWVNNAARPAAPSPAGSASAAHAQIVTGPWQFPTCWTRRWSPSPTNSQPSGRLTAKATHGLPFAQVQRSAPRAGRHQMEIRDADGRGELKQVEDNILLSADAYPLPARCPPVGAALKLGDRGGVPSGGRDPGAGFVTPSPISCHDIPQGSLPGADLSTNTGRDNAAGPLPHSSPPHPEDAPGSPKNCRRGGDFHLAKNGDRKLAIDTFGKDLTAGQRSAVVVDLTRISDSCGYAVPLMDFRDDRDLLDRWQERHDDAFFPDYWRQRNAVSIDGLRAMDVPAPNGRVAGG